MRGLTDVEHAMLLDCVGTSKPPVEEILHLASLVTDEDRRVARCLVGRGLLAEVRDENVRTSMWLIEYVVYHHTTPLGRLAMAIHRALQVGFDEDAV